MSGQNSIVVGSGRIKLQKIIISASFVMTVVFIWLGFACGMGLYAIGWAFWLMSMIYSLGNVLVAKRVVGLPIMPWMKEVVLPLVLSCLLCAMIAYLPRCFMEMSFARVAVTAMVFVVLFLPVSWLWVLNAGERQFVTSKIRERVMGKLSN